MDKKYTTKSFKQTQKLGQNFAKEILARRPSMGAGVLALSGNLGSGKTTFLQGLAKGLGIKEKILSPTYVLYKKFPCHQNRRPSTLMTMRFYHFDCYRINKSKEILDLGFTEIISDQKNIVAIEWPEKIFKVLPKNIIKINFKFISEGEREITFEV